MKTSELLTDAFERIEQIISPVVKGAPAELLNWRPNGTGNSISWLYWHLSRVQDDQIADVAGVESVWKKGGYAEKFGFALDPNSNGYAATSAEVDAVHVENVELLDEYFRKTMETTLAYVATLTDPDLDRVVDTRWTPVVTLGARLVSIINDGVQHGGQAAYVKGLYTP